jgi:cytochrome bd-type quinol oxidase subunit 2
LFAFSFLAQSLIPFFVLPCLHNWYLGHNRNDERWKVKTLVRVSYLAVAPLYLLIAWIFNPPVEERRDYFTPGLSGVVRALVILLAVSLVFVWSASRKQKDQEQWRTNVLFSLSFLFLAFGAAAYIASGRLVDISEWMLNFVPRASDWDSRHQLLLGLGISLLVSTFLMTIDKTRRTRAFVGFIVLCVVLNFSMMQGYYVDALKQKEVVSLLSKIEGISDWKKVVVADEANVYNARNRGIRSYEWEQMIVKAGGNEKVVVVTSTQPCATDQKQESAVFLIIGSSQGRLASMVKGEVKLNIGVNSVSICP